MEQETKIGLGIGGAIVLIVLFLIFSPITIIGANQKGLKFTFGKISQATYDNGIYFHWPMPIQSFKKYTTQPMMIEQDIKVDDNGAATKDKQTLGTTLTLFYKYDSNRLTEMYTQYGEQRIKEILTKALMETMKAEVGKYTIDEVIPGQDKIRKDALTILKEKTSQYPVTITELNTTNYTWSDAYDAQIQETLARTQQVKQKEQEKNMAEQTAGIGVVQAEAEKKIAITKAEGEKAAAQLMAEAKALEGEGIRKYNESVRSNMEQEIKFRELEIAKIRAEKWNGVNVPNNMYGPIPVNTVGGVQQ